MGKTDSLNRQGEGQGKGQDEALFAAVCAGDASGVAALLAAGADASCADPATGRPCLHEAVLRGHSGVVEKLCRAGADADARDRDGCTALLHAARGKARVSTIRTLLEFGADPNAARIDARGRECDTPLHHRCDDSDMLAIDLLLEAGADPLKRDEATGETPFDAIPSICRGVQRQVQPYIDLPRVELSRPFTRADVLCEKDSGLSPLANPLTWRELPRINAVLARAGEAPIGKAEAFRPAANNLSPMARLGATQLFGLMAQRLNAQGERLCVADFLSTPETAALLEKPAVLGAIFCYDNVCLGTAKDMERDRNALPEPLRETLGNYHQLRSVLQQEKEIATRGDFGRRRI